MKIERSEGHIEFIGEAEYFERDGRVYRAHVDYPVSAAGYRQGARFECYPHSWPQARRLAVEADERFRD